MIVVHHRYDFDQTEPVLAYDPERPAIWGNERLCQTHIDKVGLSAAEFAHFFDGPNYIAAQVDDDTDPFADLPNAEQWMWNYPPGEEEMPEEPQIHPPESFYRARTAEKAAESALRAFKESGGGGDTGNENDSTTEADYGTLDDTLHGMHKRICQWDGDDLSKAPAAWEQDEDIPEYVKQSIRDVLEQGVMWDDYDGYSEQAARAIRNSLEENLTQPQGFSIKSLVDDLRDLYPGMSEKKAVNIVRTETSAIFNTARELGYKERPDSDDYVYYWQGPADSRRTKVCEEISEEVEKRGGSVPLPQLKSIVRAKARKYKGTREGGTPERADEWCPHYQCRHTFVRDVKASL